MRKRKHYNTFGLPRSENANTRTFLDCQDESRAFIVDAYMTTTWQPTWQPTWQLISWYVSAYSQENMEHVIYWEVVCLANVTVLHKKMSCHVGCHVVVMYIGGNWGRQGAEGWQPSKLAHTLSCTVHCGGLITWAGEGENKSVCIFAIQIGRLGLEGWVQ